MGLYTTPPARRWLYEAEGVSGFVWQNDDAGVIAISSGDVDMLNDEDTDEVNINRASSLTTSDIAYIGFILSNDGKVTHTFITISTTGSNPSVVVDVEWSDDTTDGRDGAWTTAESGITHLFHRAGASEDSLRPNYRALIASVAGDGSAHKAWRFKITFPSGSIATNGLRARAIHLFGPERGPANTISFREVGSDVELGADLDFEEVPRAGTPETLTFRVKNLGASQANNITLTVGQGQSYGASSGWTEISDDDIVYGSSVNIGSLAAGALSSTLYLKSSPVGGGSPSELNVHTARISVAATWV